MSDIQIIIAASVSAVLVVAIAIFYLNSVRDDSSKRLVHLLEPFEVSYNSFRKSTFASGNFDGSRGTVSLQPEGRGTYLAKMVIRFDQAGLPGFSLSTKRTVSFLRKHAHEHAVKWPRVREDFYVRTLEASLSPEQLLATFKPATLEQMDDFERKYEGLLIYTVDGTLFKKMDKELLRAVPEYKDALVLFTHFYIKKTDSNKLFHDFAHDSVKLVRALNADLASIASPTEEHDHKRRLKLKDEENPHPAGA